MPWFVAPMRHGRLAGEHSGARLDAFAQALDRVDQLERGAYGELGIVLLRDGRAPHRHDRVADELLDGAAVALDHLARHVEVARQRVAHVLGVALLRKGREADQVGEEDADEPPLGVRRGASWRRCRRAARRRRHCRERRCRRDASPALRAELGVGQVLRSRSWDSRRPASCRTRGRTWSR